MSLVLREIKGSKLTNLEMDNNLLWLSSNISSSNIISVTGSGIDASNTAITSSYFVGDGSKLTNITSSYSISSSYSNTSVSAPYYNEIDPIFVSKSSSLATTGSNIFIGNQKISGSLNQGNNTTSTGLLSYSRGSNSLSLGDYSFANGINVTSSGYASHAEGFNSVAVGTVSHAEGRENTSLGDYSHVGGYQSVSYGIYSNAHGWNVVASGSNQTVFGSHNARNNTSSLFIVGGGSSAGSAFQDAFSIEQEVTGTGVNLCHIVLPTNITHPANPKTGSTYFNPTTNLLYIYNGTSWKSGSFN